VAKPLSPIATIRLPVTPDAAVEPTAVFLVPALFDDKALAPTAVLVDTAPPPLPTVRPEIVASDVVVTVVNDGEPPLTAIVPDAEGSVTVTVPATAGADRVTAPDVSPLTTMLAIIFP
jgi:hypothetical protein